MRIALSSRASRHDWVWVSPFKKIIAPKESELEPEGDPSLEGTTDPEVQQSPEAEL